MYRIFDWVANNRKLAIFLAILTIFLISTGFYLFLNGTNRNININKALPLQGTTLTEELIWWITDEENTNIEGLNAITAGFRVKYPTINITIVNKKTELAMLEEFLANPDNQPDFITVGSKDSAFYQKYSAPNQYLKSGLNNGLYPNYLQNSVDLIENNSIKSGEVYGVPLSVDNLQMYVNKDLLNNLSGLKTPASDWETLKAQVSTFDKSKGQSLVALGGTSDVVKNYEDILGAMMVQKGIFLDSKNKTIEDGNFIKVLADYNYFKQFLTLNSNDYDAFKQGKTLYYFDYYSAKNKLKTENPNLNFLVSDLPKYADGKNLSHAKFSTTMAHKDAEYYGDDYKRLVDDFIFYLTTEETQKIYADLTNYPSSNKKIVNEQYKSNSDSDGNRRFFDQALVARAIVPSCGVKYTSTINDMMYAIQAKGINVDISVIQEVESIYKPAILNTIYNENVCLPFQFNEKR
jgi:ABC-type glycerol-3-phosphate transport system substrate-binding protein